MTDCGMSTTACPLLKVLLGKMFVDETCDLIINKAHGGQAETDAGEKLYEIVPQGCIVVEVGTPGYSNLANAIPWVMEVFRFIHEINMCPDAWDDGWPSKYPHIWIILKMEWTTATKRLAEIKARAAMQKVKEFVEERKARNAVHGLAVMGAGAAKRLLKLQKDAEEALEVAEAAARAAAAEKEGKKDLLHKFRQIIQLVLTNTRFYNEGCEIYNMSFAGSDDGTTHDRDAYIYTLLGKKKGGEQRTGGEDKLADWKKNENCQFKRIGFDDDFSRAELYKWWDKKKKGAEFRAATNRTDLLTFEDRWAWVGPKGAEYDERDGDGTWVSCPLELTVGWDDDDKAPPLTFVCPAGVDEEEVAMVKASDGHWGQVKVEGMEPGETISARWTSKVIYLEPTDKFLAPHKGEVIISKDSLQGGLEEFASAEGEAADKIYTPFEDYQSIFQQILPRRRTVIFTISCKPHRDGYEKLKDWTPRTIMDPDSHALTPELFRLWIDLLVHNDHVFRNGKRCLESCPDVVEDPLSSRQIHLQNRGIVDPIGIVEQASAVMSTVESADYLLLARETADLDQGAIEHLFVVARKDAEEDLNIIMEKEYEVDGMDGTSTGKVILKDRFKDVLKVLNCLEIYPCGADYKGSLSNMIRSIKRHLQGCLCMVCECGAGNPGCGSGCPTASSPRRPVDGGGNIARGRIAYKRKSKRRTYKKRKSRRSRRRPNKKRKSKRNKRTRRRTKRKTRRNKNK